MGRSSGGITGRTERIIHSGRVPERRKASMRRSRLIAFLRRCPEVVRTSTWRERASSSSSIRVMMSRIASAPMPAQKTRPLRAPDPYFSSRYRNSVSVSWVMVPSCSISSRVLRISSLRFSASTLRASRPASIAASIWMRRSSIFCSVAVCSSASRRRNSSVTRSDSASTIFLSLVSTALPPFSPAPRMTSPVGSKAIVTSATPLLTSASRAWTACAAALISSVRSERCCSSSSQERGLRLFELVRAAVERGALLLVRVVGLAAGAAALGLLVEREQRPAPGLLVDVGDDEEGEVEDPLEVARADVEQDPEAGRRALEVPDVADRAGRAGCGPSARGAPCARVTSTPHLSQMMPL